MYRIKFHLNSGRILEHDATPTTGTSITYSAYEVPYGSEFIGSPVNADSALCKLCDIDAYIRDSMTCVTSYDLSMI